MIVWVPASNACGRSDWPKWPLLWPDRLCDGVERKLDQAIPGQHPQREGVCQGRVLGPLIFEVYLSAYNLD